MFSQDLKELIILCGTDMEMVVLEVVKNPQSLYIYIYIYIYTPYIYPQIDIPIIRWKGIFTLEKERSEVA